MAELRLREDQREIVERVINTLRDNNFAALQAPTGYGKTVIGLFTAMMLGAKPSLCLEPRLSISLHVHKHAVDMGLRVLTTAGREKLCSFGYSLLDFARGVCHRCSLNRAISLGELNGLDGSMDFGKIKEAAEQLGVCPYRLQGLLEGQGRYDVVIAHYNRARKLVNALRPRLIIADEVHNTILPSVHRVNARELRLLLEKLGFEEGESTHLIRNPESLRILLRELVDTLILEAVGDGDLKTIIEELLSMLDSPIWYYDADEDAVVGLEVPELPRTNAKMLLMSATLPPSLLNNPSTIIVRRGWRIPVRIDSRFSMSLENVKKRKDEIKKYISDKYLTPSTVVFTTISREALIDDGVVWEDELEGKSPCDYRDKTVILRTFGRFAEGVNLDCFSRLVMLGYPLLQPNTMSRLKTRGIDEKDFTTMVTVQRTGRITRTAIKPEKLPEIILVDKRFKLIESELMNYEIEVIND
jgi:hypothetical protein